MATYHEIPMPPKRKGTDAQYMEQLYNYLYSLAETVQAVVNGLEAQNTQGTQQTEGGAQGG